MDQYNNCYHRHGLGVVLFILLGAVLLSLTFTQTTLAASLIIDPDPAPLQANGTTGTYTVSCTGGSDQVTVLVTLDAGSGTVTAPSNANQRRIKCDESQDFDFTYTAPSSGSGTATIALDNDNPTDPDGINTTYSISYGAAASPSLFFVEQNQCDTELTTGPSAITEGDQNSFFYLQVCVETATQPNMDASISVDDTRLTLENATLNSQNWNQCGSLARYCHPTQIRVKATYPSPGVNTDEPDDTATLTAGTTSAGYDDGTMPVNIEDDIGGTVAGEPYFVYQDDTTTPIDKTTVSECNGGQKNLLVCLTVAPSSATTVTLTKGSDTEGLLQNISSSVTIQANSQCSSMFSVVANTSNNTANVNNMVPVTASVGGKSADLEVSVLDNEILRSDWDWSLDGYPKFGNASQMITGSITVDSAKLPYLCSVEFNLEDDGYNGDPTEQDLTETYCDQSSWNFKFNVVGPPPDIDEVHTVEDSVSTANPIPASEFPIPIQVYNGGTFPASECVPNLCVWASNGRDDSSASSKPTYPDCETIYPPGASFYYPTFVMTASYDWLHNFYDSNASAGGSATDPDTDNFNKIIAIDSNLFPIYTALQGDQEFPNIVMRNWTSRGAGSVAKASPSVNDYMNRSVTAVANYLPYTTMIYYEYGKTDGIKAVGMRSYMQWIYALDPANNNLRRYKFIKVADNFRPAILASIPPGDVLEAPTTGDHDVKKCDDCDPCHWYIGEGDDVLCGGTGTEIACCMSTLTSKSTCFTGEQEWAFFSKSPGADCPAFTVNGSTEQVSGGSAADMPACSTGTFPPPAEYSNNPLKVTGKPQGAPKMTLPIMVEAETLRATPDGGTLTVDISFEGYSRDNASGVVFVLPTASNTVRRIPKGEIFSINASNSSCDNCVQQIPYGVSPWQVTVAKSAILDDFTNEEYGGYLPVDIYPCDGTGVTIKVPAPPNPKDNAFHVAEWEESDPTAWNALSAEEKALYSGNGRWAAIGGYLNTVPPESYSGYPSYTAVDTTKRSIGYGFQTNTSFSHAQNVRFKNPRDIDAFRDYYDVKNEGPAYIFIADTMNSRIQVFMNATGSAGEVGAPFPIRPVRVKGPNEPSGSSTIHKSNELGFRIYSSNKSVRFGDGRRADFRGYTTVDGKTYSSSKNEIGKGSFFYPHSIAVDQDPDSKDIYLFVADTYNHRIQVFRDHSGVTSQAITDKKFDFELDAGWGTYPLQTSMATTAPGNFNYRYPKGIDVMRFGNNSSYLYVADSKNYRIVKYQIGEDPPDADLKNDGITSITAKSIYYYDGTSFRVAKDPASTATIMGKPHAFNNLTAGFLNPQDVATGYSGFFIADISGEKQTVFLNNNMVYVTDYARNDTATTADLLNMRVMQFVDVPGSDVSDIWIPWSTEAVPFWTYNKNTKNLSLGQSVYGMYSGIYNSTDTGGHRGASNNIPGVPNRFSDRPAGIATMQWNTQKPIDIRVVKADKSEPAYLPMQHDLDRTLPLRIGVSSRIQRFKSPLQKARSFWNASTSGQDAIPEFLGRWDGLKSGRVHIFCYQASGVFTAHTALPEPPYSVQLDSIACPSGGFAKIVAEDADFGYSARSGTVVYKLK